MKTVELKSGKDFHFNNEKWCQENNSEELNNGFVTWNKDFQMFEIFIDSICLHSSKDLDSTKWILQQFINKFHFEFTEEIDF